MNFRPIYLILCVSTIFMSVQQCLAITDSLDVHNQKSSDRIAIAAIGDSVTSEISERAGRAPYYLIFDGNGEFIKSIKNPSQKQGRRASSGVVDLLLKESVKTVIAGKFGDKMKKLLKTNKIEFHQQTGIIIEVVDELIEK
ncbi:MAG: NifB/NifX family molybdenum-iron cluster-binding protein [Calditrichia bacterium]|nr:NifB/NifX family molybdenum-iron cluster-binding protein [Calditrichia bacterium]